MTHSRRRCRLTALLMLAGLAVGGCTATGPAAEIAPASKLRPAPGETYLALGGRLLAANEPALAMRAFNTSLTVDGVSPRAMTGAGIAAHRQGMLGAAREYLVHAQKLAPDSAIAHNNLGMVLLALKDYHGARTAFRSAMALSDDGGDETLRRNLRQAELAIAALDSGVRNDPAATQRVVRLGSDMFRLAERSDAGAGPVVGAWFSAGSIEEAENGGSAPAARSAGTAAGSDGAASSAEAEPPAGTRSSVAEGESEAEVRMASDVLADAGAEAEAEGEAGSRAGPADEVRTGGEAGGEAEQGAD